MRPVLLALAALAVAASHTCAAETTFPDRPGQHEFIRDEVGLFTPEQASRLRDQCDRLLADTAIPVVVVTLPSVQRYAGDGVTLEAYARLLFDRWGIGPAEAARPRRQG